MLYDIFDKSMLLDFMGKALKIVGNEKLVDVSNSISYPCGSNREHCLTELSAILFIFLSERLPLCIKEMKSVGDDYQNEDNKCLEELKSLINECEERKKNGGWNLRNFLDK